jgi:hypothetical protein
MARIYCEVTPITLESSYTNDDGEEVTTEIESVRVECGRCGNRAEIYGDTEASVRRGFATLREGCPRGQSNFYTGDD